MYLVRETAESAHTPAVVTAPVALTGNPPVLIAGLAASLAGAGIPVTTMNGSESPRPGAAVIVLHKGDQAPRQPGRYVSTGAIPIAAMVAPCDRFILEAISRGYRAVLDCDDTPEQLASAVQAVLAGNVVMRAGLAAQLAQDAHTRTHHQANISDEELRWLTQLASGMSVMELAAHEGYSERTLFRMLARLYRRLNVTSRGEALIVAARAGMIAP